MKARLGIILLITACGTIEGAADRDGSRQAVANHGGSFYCYGGTPFPISCVGEICDAIYARLNADGWCNPCLGTLPPDAGAEAEQSHSKFREDWDCDSYVPPEPRAGFDAYEWDASGRMVVGVR